MSISDDINLVQEDGIRKTLKSAQVIIISQWFP